MFWVAKLLGHEALSRYSRYGTYKPPASTAQERLHRRYWALSQKSKPMGKIVTAIARELVGFVWAIGVETEQQFQRRKAA
jgi:transposase